MTRILAVVLSLSTVSSGFAYQEWTRFSPAEGRCSISTPVKLEGRIEKVNDRLIGPYTFQMFQGQAGEVIYGVAWVDYGEPMKLTVQGELRANRDNLLKELGATHIRTTPISLEGNPGIHFTGETKSILITSRVYVVGSRPYLLIVMSRKRENREVEIKRFLDSFRLTARR